MNNFTKDELEDIYNSIVIMINVHGAPDEFYDLQNKILSMIENYCEHECNGEVEIFIDTCKKCNAYLLREMHHE